MVRKRAPGDVGQTNQWPDGVPQLSERPLPTVADEVGVACPPAVDPNGGDNIWPADSRTELAKAQEAVQSSKAARLSWPCTHGGLLLGRV